MGFCNWYICANTIDVVKNFAVIKNVAVKSFYCTTISGPSMALNVGLVA